MGRLGAGDGRVVLAGGSGQVGAILGRWFRASGREVVVLSRRAGAGRPGVVAWDGRTLGPWAGVVDGADAVVNLAGRSVNCRYSARNRRAILESRVDSTHIIGEAIARAASPPRVWLQAGTATIYGHRFDAPNDEATGWIGTDAPGASPDWKFSVEVAQAWEAAVAEAETSGTRRVILRSAMTMSPDPGGVFAVLLRLVRLGLGGSAGDGRQFVSWVHEEDFCRAVDLLLARADLDGPVNVAAPDPLPYAEFMRTLRRAWGVPLGLGLPAPRPILDLGAFALRTEPELVLKSRRVVPGRLLDAGFSFRFPSWDGAAADLCRRWRLAR